MEHLFDLIKYIVLGLFQGITEPIPVSSSGHLEIAEYFFGLEIEGMSFALLVNTASLFAVLLIYKDDIKRLIVNGLAYLKYKDPEAKSDFFVHHLFNRRYHSRRCNRYPIRRFYRRKPCFDQDSSITLLVTGFALWMIRNMRGRKSDGELSYRDAIIVGLAQAVALIPGISRSGATIVAAMSLGMKQETALRYSFLLYIPVSVGGMILGFSDIVKDPYLKELALPYVLAFFASLIASYFSLKWFMNIMARGNLKYFAIYCFIVGSLVIFFS